MLLQEDITRSYILAKVEAKRASKGNTVNVSEPVHRILHFIEYHHKHCEQDNDDYRTSYQEDVLGYLYPILFPVVVLFPGSILLLQLSRFIVRNKDSTEKYAKHKASDVSKVVNERKQATGQQYNNDHAQFECFKPRLIETVGLIHDVD